MATENLGNMIMRLGVDDNGVSSSMENITEKMKLVRSEMKASASQFGQLGDASDKLRQKQDGLSKLYQLQGSKIEQLKKKYDQLAAEKGENTKAALDLAEKINKEVANYNRLGQALERTTVEINTQNSAWTKAGKTLKEYGEDLEKQANRMKTIGTVGFAGITAPMGALGLMAIKSASDIKKRRDQFKRKWGSQNKKLRKPQKQQQIYGKRVSARTLAMLQT